MPSKFGGLPVEPRSKFGGVPITQGDLGDGVSTGALAGASQPGASSIDVAQPQIGAVTDQADIVSQALARSQQVVTPEMRAQRRAGILGGVEAAGTLASSIVAEPLAGIAGIAQGVNPFADEGASARAVEGTREALTFQPRTEAGKESLAGVGEALAPVAEGLEKVESALGDTTLELTGSPALAAAAATIPTAILEAIGGAGALKATAKGKLRGPSVSGVKPKQVSKALVESAPDIDVIKDASRAVYKEIDDIGAQVKPEAVNSMLKTAIRKAKQMGVDPVLMPDSNQVTKLFSEEALKKVASNVSDLDRLRQIAQNAASAIKPADARIGRAMIDEIDSFMDNIPRQAFTGEGSAAANIGKKYKTARKLWGRARRAELISDAMEKAGRQASGFENGIRTQLRQILNNKKRSRFFSKEELSAMDDVVKGSNEQNILKLVGRLGFSEGAATNVLGGLAGSAVLGPVTPVVGQISRGLAQRSTKQAAALSDALVKAGPNGKRITEAYLKTTKPKQRSASDLSQLFLDSGADIDELINSANKLTREAAEVAKGRKALLSGVAPAGIETQQEQQ